MSPRLTLPRRRRRHRRRRRAGRAHQGARPPHHAPRGDDRPGRLRRPVRHPRPATSEPLLVSCTDGVGTKLKLAFLTGRHDTVGHRPGRHERQRPGRLRRRAAVLPRLLRLGQAGGRRRRAGDRRHRRRLPGGRLRAGRRRDRRAARVLRRRRVRPGRLLRRRRREEPPRRRAAPSQAGDKLLGLASSGFHSNGYSLVRECSSKKCASTSTPPPPGLDEPLGEALLRPTRIYVRALRALADADLLRGAAHITGGGLVDNPTAHDPRRRTPQAAAPARQLGGAAGVRAAGRAAAASPPRRCAAPSTWASACWSASPPIAPAEATRVLEAIGRAGLRGRRGGGRRRTRRAGGVPHAMNVGVLVSGSGTNLQALIDSARAASSARRA